MNLNKLERLLKQTNPRYRIRQRGFNHVAGIFLGNEFMLTVTKGHIPLNSYRMVAQTNDRLKERIIKRGRADALRILNRRRKLGRKESIKIKWGKNAKD